MNSRPVAKRQPDQNSARAVDRERQEQDLKDELAFHFNTEVEGRVAAGQSAAEALASAKRFRQRPAGGGGHAGTCGDG